MYRCKPLNELPMDPEMKMVYKCAITIQMLSYMGFKFNDKAYRLFKSDYMPNIFQFDTPTPIEAA